MRDIKFRGKEVRSGEWVYGGFANIEGSPCIVKPVLEFDEIQGCELPVLYSVDPSTVGQFTGIKDMYGKEIYEGDVIYLHAFPEENAEEVQTGTAEIYWKDIDMEFQLRALRFNNEWAMTTWSGWASETWEVIGNIHDNPELIAPEQGISGS
jgi:uncharacterized phage protein (TIGR01671 family)